MLSSILCVCCVRAVAFIMLDGIGKQVLIQRLPLKWFVVF